MTTKNFETLEVGMWYETRAGAIVKVTHFDNEHDYPFDANNGDCYTHEGKFNISAVEPVGRDLIRCLGADPFNQAPVVENATAQNGLTLYQQIFIAVLPSYISNAVNYKDGMTVKNVIHHALAATDEAMKQLKEKGMV